MSRIFYHPLKKGQANQTRHPSTISFDEDPKTRGEYIEFIVAFIWNFENI